jgi:hypothetical protein
LEACFVIRDHNGQQLAMPISRMSRGDDQRPNYLANARPSLSAVAHTRLAQQLAQSRTIAQELKQQPKGHDKPE